MVFVKQRLSEIVQRQLPPGLPIIPDEFKPKLKLITRKPILPSDIELEENNRARSAKLRIAEKR